MATGSRRLLAAGALALLLAPALPFAAAEGATDAERVARALEWVASQQQADGRWALTAQGYPSEAAASAGLDPKRWPSPERSAFASLAPESCSWKTIPSERQDCVYKSLLRVTHAAGVSGYDPRAVNGRDAVAEVRAGYVGGQFGDATFVNDDVWAILALRAAGVPRDDLQLRSALEVVKASRAGDGGWAYRSVATAGDVDMTGMALAALAAMGERTEDDAAAKAFLARMRDPSTGGYRAMANGSPNCQSTLWGLHAERALGLASNEAALRFLRSLQREGGGFATSPSSAQPDLFCTVEAIVVLSGERYPLPGYAPPPAPEWVIHAGEPVALPVPAPFRTAVLEDVAPAIARGAPLFFPRAGEYAYRALAEGDGIRARWDGTLQVLSARPVLPELPGALQALRGSNVTLDLASTGDSDGVVTLVEVDWGDGNRTTLPEPGPASHAYAMPGRYHVTVQARDDAGVASAARTLTVDIANRAPLLAALPGRLVADRVQPLRFAANATDPDGDPVRIAWRVGDLSGDGAAEIRLASLGNHTLHVEAEDPFGGRVAANLTVEVVNLPPTLSNVSVPSRWTADAPFPFRAQSADADGPAPLVSWRLGPLSHEGASGEASLPVGEHEVEVVARDADGASATLRARIAIEQAPPAAPHPAEVAPATPPPSGADAPAAPLSEPVFAPLGAVEAGEPARVAVEHVEEAVAYRFEFGDGAETPWSESAEVAHAWARPGSYELRAWARSADERTSMRATTVVVAPRPTPPPTASPTPEDATEADPGEPLAPVEDVVELRPQGAPSSREVPAPLPLAAIALALLLARRGRRARSA